MYRHTTTRTKPRPTHGGMRRDHSGRRGTRALDKQIQEALADRTQAVRT